MIWWSNDLVFMVCVRYIFLSQYSLPKQDSELSGFLSTLHHSYGPTLTGISNVFLLMCFLLLYVLLLMSLLWTLTNVEPWLIRTLTSPDLCLNSPLTYPDLCLYRTLTNPDLCLNRTVTSPHLCLNKTLTYLDLCLNRTVTNPLLCLNKILFVSCFILWLCTKFDSNIWNKIKGI